MKTERLKLSCDPRMRAPFSLGQLSLALLCVGLGAAAGLSPAYLPEQISGPATLMVYLFGGIFVVTGFIMVLQGVIALAEARRRPGGREPWFHDHGWNPQGAFDRSKTNVLLAVGRIALFAVFLLPFHIFLWMNEGEGPVWVYHVVIGLFDLLFLGLAGQQAYRAIGWMKYGSKRLRYGTFPFFSGEPMRVRFEGGGDLARCEVQATLRLVENVSEEVRNRDRHSNRKTTVYQLWKQEVAARTDTLGMADFQFMVPDNAPATSLKPGAPWCLYWEVVVRVPMPVVGYEGTFLVPVYQRVVHRMSFTRARAA